MDVRLHVHQGYGAHDVILWHGQERERPLPRLFVHQGYGVHDVVLWPQAYPPTPTAAPGGGFPTQYPGDRVYLGAAVVDLCLVAFADAPLGMGQVEALYVNGAAYAEYLVETTDPDASPVRVRTSAGTKAIRRLT